MVHYLNDRKLWAQKGEKYLQNVRSKPPVHPMITAARTTRGIKGGFSIE
jgi:hypothetical protein